MDLNNKTQNNNQSIHCLHCNKKITRSNMARHVRDDCWVNLNFRGRLTYRQIKDSVENTCEQISVLRTINQELDSENNELKSQIKDLNEENFKLKLENKDLLLALGEKSRHEYTPENISSLIRTLKIKNSTLKNYLSVWKKYTEWCPTFNLWPLMVSTANKYVTYLFKEENNTYTYTISKVRCILQSILRRALGTDQVFLEKIRTEKQFKKVKTFLNLSEMDDFLKFLKNKNSIYYIQVLIQRMTGARINGIANLKIEHLLFLRSENSNQIYIPDHKNKNSSREHYLDEQTRDLLKNYYNTHRLLLQNRKYLFYCGEKDNNKHEINMGPEEEHYRRASYLSRRLNKEGRLWAKSKDILNFTTHGVRRFWFNNTLDTITTGIVEEISKHAKHSNVQITKDFYLSKKRINIQEAVEEKIKELSKDKKITNKSKSKGSKKSIKTQIQEPIRQFKIANVSNKEKLIFKDSFKQALSEKNIAFNDDLVFNLPPDSVDAASSEQHIQKMPNYMVEVYEKFKNLSRKRIYAPLELFEDPDEGWSVRATNDIEKHTLICEYSGVVVDFSENMNSDAIMEFYTTDESKLVIYPDEQGNLARFISGINNEKVKSILKKKQSKYLWSGDAEEVRFANCQSQKFNINGSLHILIYTSRKILKGETLYYDYNSGWLNEMDTTNYK